MGQILGTRSTNFAAKPVSSAFLRKPLHLWISGVLISKVARVICRWSISCRSGQRSFTCRPWNEKSWKRNVRATKEWVVSRSLPLESVYPLSGEIVTLIQLLKTRYLSYSIAAAQFSICPETTRKLRIIAIIICRTLFLAYLRDNERDLFKRGR